jgi:hypothetical protein
MLPALAAVLAVSMLAALAGLMLSALSGILRLLARLVLAAALLLAGLLLTTLLMLRIVGVLRHGLSPLKPWPRNPFSLQLWPGCGRNVETDSPHKMQI